MRKPELILLGVSILMLVAVPTNALVIQPSWVEFTGNYGTWQMKNITLINDENKTIDVTIQPSSALSDCYLSRPEITIPPNSKVNVTIGVQLSSETHGFILYTYGGQQINQFILLTPEKNNVSIDMIPPTPTPGGSIVFLLNPYVNGAGFVYVAKTNAIYNFTIMNGLAFVSLHANDVGDAVAVFQGANFHTTKIFTIRGAVTSELKLIAPSTANLNDNVALTLKSGSEVVPSVPINITEPNGNNYYKTTDSSGKINVKLDKQGVWHFSASYNGNTTTASISVGGGGANVMLVAPDSVKIGDKKWITLVANSNPVPNNDVMVLYPDGSMQAFSTNQYGQFQFLFDQVGTFKFTSNYQGSNAAKSVVVQKKEANITVPDKAFVGSSVVMSVPAGASITITGASHNIHDTVSGTSYSFFPDRAGKYSIHVETKYSKADATLYVYEMPSISVYDMNHNPVINAEKGKTYTIYVTDRYGNHLNVSSVKVQDPSGFTTVLNVAGGYAVWIPDKAGTYTISTPKQGFYYTSSKTISVLTHHSGGWAYAYAIIALVAILLIVKYRDRIIHKIKKEKNEGKPKEERKELE